MGCLMAPKPRTTFKPSSVLSLKQLMELWVKAGGPVTAAPLAGAIALAESKGVVSATNHNTNGSIDRGPWQINSVHSQYNAAQLLTDPEYSAKAAVEIFKAKGENFTDWTTFNNGAAQKILKGENPLKVAEALETVPGSGVTSNFKVPLPGFDWSKLSEFAVKLVLVLAGAVLVVYGVMVAVRPRESAFNFPKMPVPVPV